MAGTGPPALPADVDNEITMNRWQRIYVSWLIDVLVYIVILNLYIQYSTAKVIDSFTISILTAILLKLLLVAITAGKYRVWTWSKSKDARTYTILGVLGVWAILFLSKFVILEAVDFVFGDQVDLGSLIDVMLLVATMMIVREAVHRLYQRLGRRTARKHP